MTSKIKTIVCGSTFGQFYIDALMKYSEFFEIAGLYARGSERSIELAKRYGIPLFTSIKGIPTAAVLTVYGTVLKKWSFNKDVCLNLTVLNRETSDKNINKVVGDFTKILLLEIRNLHDTFSDMAQDINATLFESLDHCGYSGVDVIRDISKTKGRCCIGCIIFRWSVCSY